MVRYGVDPRPLRKSQPHVNPQRHLWQHAFLLHVPGRRGAPRRRAQLTRTRGSEITTYLYSLSFPTPSPAKFLVISGVIIPVILL